jgi:hypothetical protein
LRKENGLECADNELITLSSHQVFTSSTNFEGNQQQLKQDSNSAENDVIDNGLH